MKNTYYIRSLFILLMTVLLAGCLYPQSKLEKNESPNETQLDMVQNSVEKYREQTGGLLPIKTKENDTPIFQKYLIDFNLLKQEHIMAELPGNAYENGGIYQYTIITPEDNPRVKLIDLRMTETIRDINVKLEIYRNKHLYPPFGEEVADGVYKIDYEKLGFKSPLYVVSPFTKENLPVVMNTEGKLYVDYRIDLNNALEKYDHNYKEGEDIRYLLAENTPFVPAYSLPYTVHNGVPVFQTNK